jgi:Flp pilus assembly pilin Flp
MLRFLHFVATAPRPLASQRGQTLIEYGLILTLIGIVGILFLGSFGIDMAETLDAVENALGIGDPDVVPTGLGDEDITAPS